MADCSLEDYIKQKGIRLNLGRRAALEGKSSAAAPDSSKFFMRKPITGPVRKPITAPVRKLITGPVRKPITGPVRKPITGPVTSLMTRKLPTFDARLKLSSATVKNVGASPNKNVVSLLARNVGTGPKAMPDARQKLLAKTKFTDARQRIVDKQLQKGRENNASASVVDMRRKLQVKRGITMQQLQQQRQQQQQQLQHPLMGSLNAGVGVVPLFQGKAFNWADATPMASNSFIINQPCQEVMNMGGSLFRTVPNWPPVTSLQPTVIRKSNADFIGVPALQPQQFLNTSNNNITITMRNDQLNSAAVSQPLYFQQTIPKRFPLSFGTKVQQLINEQPIKTIVSERPTTRVLNKPQPITRLADIAFPIASIPSARPEVTKLQPPSVIDSVSPLQGFRIHVSNLHPNVTQEDIMELFGALGALKKALLLKAGIADVVYVNYEDAVIAVKKYHLRELDGQPMKVVFQGPRQNIDAKILNSLHQPHKLSQMTGKPVIELEPGILHKALFKPPPSEQTPTNPVSFTVHM